MSADLRLVKPSVMPDPPEAPGPDAPEGAIKLPIRKWARADRPRERLLDAGPASLSDAELFALFLRTGVSGVNAIDVARQLIKRFGSLRGVLDASELELREQRGIGPARAATLLAVSELCRRALVEKARDRELLNAPGAVEDYLRLFIGTRPYEVFVCLYLDARHQLLLAEESARGSLTRVAVYPREIVRRALTLNAAGLIVAHNHPSGGVEPSANDRRLTKTLHDALMLIDVRLLDHIVVAANEVFSFAREGWL